MDFVLILVFYVGNSSSSLAVSNSSLAIGNVNLGTEKSDANTNASNSSAVQTSIPSEPYFIVPPGFRPNTFFVGMEKYACNQITGVGTATNISYVDSCEILTEDFSTKEGMMGRRVFSYTVSQVVASRT